MPKERKKELVVHPAEYANSILLRFLWQKKAPHGEARRLKWFTTE